jgi:hypothetical protein
MHNHVPPFIPRASKTAKTKGTGLQPRVSKTADARRQKDGTGLQPANWMAAAPITVNSDASTATESIVLFSIRMLLEKGPSV